METVKISNLEKETLRRIGRAIQCYATKKEVSIAAISKATHSSTKYVEQILAGKANPSFLTLLKITDLFNIDLDELIEKSRSKNIENELYLFMIWKISSDSRSPAMFYKHVRGTDYADAISRSKIKLNKGITQEAIKQQLTFPNVYFKCEANFTYLINKS